MKKIILTTTLSLLIYNSVFSQNNKDFNRWSIELNAGVNNPTKTFTTGYFTNATPENLYDFGGINHYDLGVRFMFTEVYGAKLDFGYDTFKNMSSSYSLPFSTKKYRVGGQGVLNLRKLFGFDSFTNTFGLLFHAGGHFSIFDFKNTSGESLPLANGLDREFDLGYMVGLTPQIKISDKLVATLDYTFIGNVHQEITWDGINYSREDQEASRIKFDSGYLHNFSVGLTYYVGTKESHADFYEYVAPVVVEPKKPDTDKDGVIDEKDECPEIAGLRRLKGCPDTDNDGIADHLDKCPKEKGTKENGGCPVKVAEVKEKVETTVQNNAIKEPVKETVVEKKPVESTKKPVESTKKPDVVKNQVSKTEVTKAEAPKQAVTKESKISEPTNYITNADSKLIDEYTKYITYATGSYDYEEQGFMLYNIAAILKFNPAYNITIEGHTDNEGSKSFNKVLSEKRAQKVKLYLVNNGVEESRIKTVGYGSTRPVDKAGKARNRRVEIKINQ